MENIENTTVPVVEKLADTSVDFSYQSNLARERIEKSSILFVKSITIELHR